eukprot:4615494-Prymnesium_polylepis.1
MEAQRGGPDGAGTPVARRQRWPAPSWPHRRGRALRLRRTTDLPSCSSRAGGASGSCSPSHPAACL